MDQLMQKSLVYFPVAVGGQGKGVKGIPPPPTPPNFDIFIFNHKSVGLPWKSWAYS